MMLTPFPARSLRCLHEFLGCGSHLPPPSRSTVLRWLQESKQEWSSMADLRAVLGRGDEGRDLSRMHDESVIDRLVSLLEAGQLHVCIPAGSSVASRANEPHASATANSPARAAHNMPQRPRPFPLPGVLPEVPHAIAPGRAGPGLGKPLQGTPSLGMAQVLPEHRVAFSGAREEPAKPQPINKPKPRTEGTAKPVLHWFPVALKAAPELKARPAWYPAAAGSPVGYGGNKAIITLGGVSPPEQQLDPSGQFHVDLIPPGSANVHFRDYFAALEPVFIEGTSV